MQIGAMNHPASDLITEVRKFAALGLDFIDLTLEPPAAAPRKVRAQELKKVIADASLGVVGHTAYYLPLGSPFESLRKAAVDELSRSVEVFAEVGVRWMNVHPDAYAPMHDRIFSIQRNAESLRELLALGQQVGVGIMIENLPGHFNTAEQLGDLLNPLPQLGLHLDIGHANLDVEQNTTPSILAAYGARVRHVHLHDNKGGRADLHLPLGAGTLDVPARIRELKRSGYDGTITLEVFSPDNEYLTYSRDVLRRLWDTA